MQNKPTIICISGKAEHGKTTFRNFVSDYLTVAGINHAKLSYGNYVKFVAKEFFGWDGKKDEAGRTLLQWIGTDWTKSKDRDYWIKCAMRDVDMFSDATRWRYVLIDDCRFEEEISLWENSGYRVITTRVKRLEYTSSLTDDQLKHPSETSLDSYKFDNVINATTKEGLDRNALYFVARELL